MPEFGAAAVATRIAEIRAKFSSARPATAVNGEAFAGALAKASGPGGGSNAAQKVIDIAKEWLGTPYVYGGNDPKKGLDCSGLVQQAFKRIGIELPRVTYDQVKEGTEVKGIENAKPGDLVFTVGDIGRRVNGHVGIYLGDGKWIEAPYTGANVRITDVPKNITAIRRVIPAEAAPVAVPSAALSQLAAGLNPATIRSIQGMTA
jgi:cell wall-associated NlpC family hydrolase